MEKHKFRNEEVITDKEEYTDFIIVGDEIYPEDEFQTKAVDDLPDVFDEDLLYEAYRDDHFERDKLRRDL